MLNFRHLKEKNMGYFEHAKHSLKLSASCFKASAFLFIHAIYPDVLVDNGTTTMRIALEEHDSYKNKDLNTVKTLAELFDKSK